MNISVEPGLFVIAVSGGVDSMVLLDVIRNLPNVDLVIAHLDHGIRPDSVADRQLVQDTAAKYGLAFEFGEAHLGIGASEANARGIRYKFLREVKSKHQAKAIITAHQQDDVLETAILNMIRGTGRKGLSSLKSTDEILRPLLLVPKSEILEYAAEHNILWHEDSTNSDDRYLRNYVRHQLVTRLRSDQKLKLSEYITQTSSLNVQMDDLLSDLLESNVTESGIERKWFIKLPYDVSAETMASWLRSNSIREFDRKLINRLVVAGKTALPGKIVDIDKGHVLCILKDRLRIDGRQI
jgi:tRNA(Ile)-lysidine synthase